MLDDEDLVFLHFAPPCGTASRARDIRRTDGYDPPKLRSTCAPDGLPFLTGVLQDRVTAANELYSFTGRLCSECWDRGVLFCVENPWRSYMWDTSHWRSHTASLPLHHTVFQHCMYGGVRDKTTRFCHVVDTFCSLGVMCDGNHEHAPWGQATSTKWATSEETAYPYGLCRSMASCLIDQLLSFGVLPNPTSLDCVGNNAPAHLLAQVAHGKQPKSKRIPPLVKEFQTVVTLTGPQSALPPPKMDQAWPIPADISTDPPCQTLPAGTRVIRLQHIGGDSGSSNDASANLGPEAQLCRAVVGIPWSIDDFIAQALDVKHPRLMVDGIPPETEAAIDRTSNTPGHLLISQRADTLRRWMSRALELNEDEQNLKDELPEHCARVLRSKRLLLFSELLKEVDYPDTGISAQMAGGFDLVGRIPPSGVFNKRKTIANISPDDLRSTARRTRAGILQSMRSSGDLDIDHGVYKATLDELQRGWLHGPYPLSEIPLTASITRRFGIKQGTREDGTAKIRPIDDFTESQINLTNSCGESVSLHGTDVLGAVGVRLAELCGPGGALHPSEVLVRTWDLHKAYKNLALSLDALQDAYLAVFNPTTGDVELYGQYVLPFGARASVNGFCRVSHALWAIGSKGLGIIWCVYFDDFVVFSLSHGSGSTGLCVEVLLALLGWAVAADKESAFNGACKALGLVLDMSSAKLGFVVMDNTAKRKAEIAADINETLARNELSRAEAQRLRGRLLFAESQVYGRRSTKAMGVLSSFIQRGRGKAVTEELRTALIFLRDKIAAGKPKTLFPFTGGCIHIYTDASFDKGQDAGGIGCVTIDPATGHREFIAFAVSRKQVDTLCFEKRDQPIFELETFAIYVALRSWTNRLQKRPIIVFTDNDGALGACISCRSENITGWHLVSCICRLEESLNSHVWYERVNTASNLADLPSRLTTSDPRLGSRLDISFEDVRDLFLSELVEQGV